MSEDNQQEQPIQPSKTNSVETPVPPASSTQPVQHGKRRLRQGGQNIEEA